MQYYGRRNKSLAQAVYKEDLNDILDSAEWVIVDIRMPLDFNDGHLKGALNLTTQQEFEELLTKTDKKILLNCYSGHTVALLGSDLVQQGFSNIYFLDEEIQNCLN